MTAHPLVARYMQRKGIATERLRSDGRLTLSLRSRAGTPCRLQMQPLPGGGLLFESRIAALPAAPQPRAERIEQLLRASATRLVTHEQALAIDRDAACVVLQQQLDDGLSPVAFDDLVEAFMRATLFWQAVVSQP